MRRRWRGPLLGIGSVVLIQAILYIFITSINQSVYNEEYDVLLKRISTHSHLPAGVNATINLKAPPVNCTHNATVEKSLDRLLSLTASTKQWKWIMQRASAMWPQWVTETLNGLQNQSFSLGRQLRVLVVPGIFIATDFADASTISSGGPLGDLVQWADLIAALHVLGHNVTLEWDVYQAVRGLRYDKYLWTDTSGCPKTGMDLVFTDIIALKTFPPEVLKKHSCRIRVVDAYGTEAMYNHPKYSLKHGYNSPYYGRLGLDLRQFLTFYPHTPENSFLGFVVSPLNNNATKVNSKMVLLYGKNAKYFEGMKPFISQMMQLGLEIHASLDNDTVLPQGVSNHGIVPFNEYQGLMASAKYFVGLGQPLESTAAVEALANGCIFINPRFDQNQSQQLQHMNKPTSRLLESQVTYLTQHVGPPHVYTINISNPSEVSEMFSATKDIKPSSYIPPVFTMSSFLQRLAITTQNLDICTTATKKRKIWPPLSALIPVYGQPNESCSDACHAHGLMCEYSFFRDMNKREIFSIGQLNVTCPGDLKSMDGLLYPARLIFRQVCVLQPEPLLFSCAGRHPDIQRVCPCREFLSEQPSICKQCLR